MPRPPSPTKDPVAALAWPDERKRRRAAKALAAQPRADAFGPLITALDDGDVHVRAASATALGELGDRRAVAPLCARLGADGTRTVRLAVARALAALRDPAALEALFAALLARPAEAAAITEAIVEHGADALPRALELLRGGAPRAAEAAAGIVASLAEVSAEADLLAVVRSTATPVSARLGCLRGLARIGSPAAVECLVQRLASDQPEEAALAHELVACAQRGLGDADLSEALLAVLRSPRADARARALEVCARRPPDGRWVDALAELAGEAARTPGDTRSLWVDARGTMRASLARVLRGLGERGRPVAECVVGPAFDAVGDEAPPLHLFELLSAACACLGAGHDEALLELALRPGRGFDVYGHELALALRVIGEVGARAAADSGDAARARLARCIEVVADALGRGQPGAAVAFDLLGPVVHLAARAQRDRLLASLEFEGGPSKWQVHALERVAHLDDPLDPAILAALEGLVRRVVWGGHANLELADLLRGLGEAGRQVLLRSLSSPEPRAFGGAAALVYVWQPRDPLFAPPLVAAVRTRRDWTASTARSALDVFGKAALPALDEALDAPADAPGCVNTAADQWLRDLRARIAAQR